MDGLAAGFIQLLGICLAAGFLIELIINRRPVVVAILVTLVAALILFVWGGSQVGFHVDGDFVQIFGVLMLFGFLASLIGSGAGRGLRMLYEMRSMDRDSEQQE